MIDRRTAIATLAVASTLGWCAPRGGGEAGGLPPLDLPVDDTPADKEAVRRFRAWQKENALPAIFLEPVGPALSTPGGSRIGGPVWLPAGETWPADAKGVPMTFLGQVDFASLPRLEDYPEAGVLQFFIGHDIYFGADLDRPEGGSFRVLWRPALDGPGAMHLGKVRNDPRHNFDPNSPLEPRSVTTGYRLAGRAGVHEPTINDWRFHRDLRDIAEGRGRGGVNRLVNAQFTARPERHHIGGNPEFTQDDWRGTPAYNDYDRVLLNLWSDRTVMWGDMGQGQFMIRRADLLARDFSRVAYQWDCS
ncbi:hypothetical protein A6F68_00166 [Tsuneonella dongtanensis]|uniref:DUF1963 domain-containing protein n=1 Tax=Tsuneonella dongtanensis TaxID=692370 RepID=A0A1B2A9B5_9SPHN|nr:DUF1963 domain-containing protein [Tsuneonella dongtanensis]ANY18701.1 hypothetical protein A6F68_00166 [Tsuneonella dongtanensis]